jgi:hypothetical protein
VFHQHNNYSTGKSRGFGFITYKDSKTVDDVLSRVHMIDGKEVNIENNDLQKG